MVAAGSGGERRLVLGLQGQQRARPRTAAAAAAGVQLAAEHADALAHADEPVAAALDPRRRRARPASAIVISSRVVLVESHQHPVAAPPPCFTALVSASCTTR